MRKYLDDRWVTAVLTLYAVGVAVVPWAAGLPVTVEDGFYYLKIARNIAGGAGSTYDGEHLTNGYHPLWMLCLVPVFAVAADPGQALVLATAVQVAMAAAAAGLLYRAARRLTGKTGAAVAVLLWIELTEPLWLQGLEFALECLALTATLYVYLRWFGERAPRTAGPFLALGLACAAVFLARLDAALLGAFLGAALLADAWRKGLGRSEVRRLAVFAAPLAAAALAYVAVSLHLFDHVTPVSAAAKRAWSETLVRQHPSYPEHGWAFVKAASAVRPLIHGWSVALRPITLSLLVVGAAAGAGLVARLRRRARPGTLRALLPWISCGLASYVTYVLTFHRTLFMTPRYYALQLLVAALLAGIAAGRATAWLAAVRPAAARAARVLALSFLLVLTARGLAERLADHRAAPGYPQLEAAAWTARHLGDDARIGSWNLGTVGYLSGRTVLNLDGLVNSWEFFERDRHDLCAYWQKARITHLVDVFRNTGDPERVVAISPVDVHVECPEDLELLWRSDRYGAAWSVRAYRVVSRRSPGP